jgi:spermidine synthase
VTRQDAAHRHAVLVAYACLFFSGASALVYEVVWMRHLRLVTGATTAAVSTVLAVYMGGLALGAFLFGRVADRSRAPLRLYGYLEAAIGAYALFLPWLLRESTPLYVAMASAAAGRPLLLAALRAGLGAVLLLLPTVLMGGTLPVLVRCVGRDVARFGRSLGFLYGVNLAGAVVGTVAAAFLLMPRLGIHGATLAAATVNLAIGAVCILYGARATPAEAAAAAVSRAAEAPPPAPFTARRLLLAVTFFSGYASMAYEVLWTRILLFAFTSTVQAFAVILATFLAGLAVGSGLFALLESRFDRWRTLAVVQSLAGALSLLFVPASLAALRVIEGLHAGSRGNERTIVVGMSLAAALVILVPATLMGLVFPLASRILAGDLARAGHGIGRAYTVNTVGGVLGSLLTGFLSIPLLGLKNSLLLLALSQMALGWAVVRASGFTRRRGQWVMAASALAMALAVASALLLLRGPNPFDHVPADTILAHRDDVTASVSVVKDENGGRDLRIDGFVASGADPITREGAPPATLRFGYMGLMTHIPMLLHPDPRRLLVICFGTGTTAGAGLAHAGAQVTAVDINPTVFAFAGHFAAANRDVARNPRARLVVDDGRNYLLTTRETFDVITSEPMPPRFAGVSSLYSREYYQLARQRLAPGGLLAQWLPFHLVSVGEAWAILRTVQEVFPDTTLWVHYGTGVIVARRDAPVEIDVAGLRRRLAQDPLRADMVRFGVNRAEDLTDLYMLGPDAVRRVTRGAAQVTDDRPFLEFHPSPYRTGSLVYGTWGADHAAALEIVYRLRKEDRLPLQAAGEDAPALSERHALFSHALLGSLYMDTRFWTEARQEFEAGLARSSTPASRATFVVGLDVLARRQAQR